MRGPQSIMFKHKGVRSVALYHCRWLLVFGLAEYAAMAADLSKIVGANACAECHKKEAEAWKGSHHFKTFRDMPRNAEANQIAEKMGLRRVKAESLCQSCHFTVQQNDGKVEPISGISCESCHGSGKDWIKVHSGYSGKKADTESKDEKAARWKLSASLGMIRPSSLYEIAKNCYSCHVVPREDLVNKGGHKAGSDFELLSWSQGEVRHNTWHSKGKDNVPASAARRRMLYLVGLGVELETALRAVAKSTARKPFAFVMAKRADRTRKKLAIAAKVAPNVSELAKMVEFGNSAGLKLYNERLLTIAADGVSKLLVSMTDTHDGSTLAGLDTLLPGPETYKGEATKASAGN